MNQVWLLFKMLEILAGCVCTYVHTVAALNLEEPMNHNLFLCGTFASFTLLAAIRCIRIGMGLRTLLRSLLFQSIFATVMHFLCSLVAMNYAENDFHLQFMSDVGEAQHLYFRYCRLQSIISLITGGIYLIECILVLDIIVKIPQADHMPLNVVTEPPQKEETWQHMTNDELDTWARISADIFFLGKDFDFWLRVNCKWFRRIAGSQELILFPEGCTESDSVDMQQTYTHEILG
ncbi:uncharacterized protein LOC111604774 [Drosophila hydei]|uniref:Uncharacterized protein LOC111604774 n=1 Tax=Drosophila hydei TaxID=7224 RepID=A0A6J1MH26_DROHY|nr:uncharacterized protein LOC111604774 [Drosophila hydei]